MQALFVKKKRVSSWTWDIAFTVQNYPFGFPKIMFNVSSRLVSHDNRENK